MILFWIPKIHVWLAFLPWDSSETRLRFNMWILQGDQLLNTFLHLIFTSDPTQGLKIFHKTNPNAIHTNHKGVILDPQNDHTFASSGVIPPQKKAGNFMTTVLRKKMTPAPRPLGRWCVCPGNCQTLQLLDHALAKILDPIKQHQCNKDFLVTQKKFARLLHPDFCSGSSGLSWSTSTTEFDKVWSRVKALMTQNWLIGQESCASRAELFWAKRRSCQNPASSSWQQQQQVWTENHSSSCKSLSFLGFWFRRTIGHWIGPVLMARPWVSRLGQSISECSTCYPPKHIPPFTGASRKTMV